ncbi:MAG: histidine phosphatase family protein [Candidatus Riflebacteria bacterium]|nr:histidine phosphatase family protein [Candidatus Riflebacteria bacterium]
MRYLEIRRHSIRQKPGIHLSHEGVLLARKTGETIGPFSKVVTSNLARAVETAVAMGFAVDEENELLGYYDDKVEKEVRWNASFEDLAEAIRQGKKTEKFASNLKRLLTEIAEKMPDETSLLVITHGGLLEIIGVICFPQADYSTWGGSFQFCEGIKLGFDGKNFVSWELLRVSTCA